MLEAFDVAGSLGNFKQSRRQLWCIHDLEDIFKEPVLGQTRLSVHQVIGLLLDQASLLVVLLGRLRQALGSEEQLVDDLALTKLANTASFPDLVGLSGTQHLVKDIEQHLGHDLLIIGL